MKGPRIIAWAAGLVLVGTGLWAFFAARSFYEQVATYPPYNEHFLSDIGAFTLGLGATVLLAIALRDSLLAALAGNAVGATFHAVSHVLDAEIGRARDPWLTSLFAVLLLAGTAWRWKEARR